MKYNKNNLSITIIDILSQFSMSQFVFDKCQNEKKKGKKKGR